MDEIYGYFRRWPIHLQGPAFDLAQTSPAYGLGVGPDDPKSVDLDYKGLSIPEHGSSAGLQTERDKLRVLEGLEGASAAQGQTFDRARMEQILSGLGKPDLPAAQCP
jgi:hypothetical protein